MDDETQLLRLVSSVHVIEPGLLVTNIVSANSRPILAQYDIHPKAILCLDAKSQARFPPDDRSILDLADAENPDYLFEAAIRRLAALREQHPTVLLHCHAGRSRSLAVAAAWLMVKRNLTLSDALDRVTQARPVAAIAPGLLLNLARFEAQLGRD